MMYRFRGMAVNRRALGGIAFAFILYAADASIFGQASQSEQHWVGTWSASATGRVDQPAAPAPSAQASANTPPLFIPPAVLAVAPDQVLPIGTQSPLHFNNQTLRQIVHISLGGPRLRVVVANTFGTVPVTIGAARVALRDKDAAIVPGSSRVLTFGGTAAPAVSAGAILVSDPVDLVVPAFADLSIDLYLPGDTAVMKSPITTHPAALQTSYVSIHGNHAGAVSLPVQTTTAYRREGSPGGTWFFLARVEVMAPAEAGAIVTIGDSLTDGARSTMDTNNRWPDHLATRLALAGIPMGVLNAGIGGNRVLSDGVGPGALARFDRDVLAQPGVTHVVVLEGINDIGQAGQNPLPSAADLMASHQQMIERAHTRGLRIYGATLTPFAGANYWTPEGEAKRQLLNDWIRTGKAYDAVLDFDNVVRDPSQPTKLLAQFDAGDHLHLNAAGYQALANTIDLALFQLRLMTPVKGNR
jgi:lysophospholipase L1-like esterase